MSTTQQRTNNGPDDPLDPKKWKPDVTDEGARIIREMVSVRMTQLTNLQREGRENVPFDWRILHVEDDPDGKKASLIIAIEFTRLAAVMGVEQFGQLPVMLLKELVITYTIADIDPYSVVHTAFKSSLIAYANPDTREEAAEHLQALNLLAKKVMDAEAKRTEMQNPTATTVH